MDLIGQLKDYQILPEGGRAAYYLFNHFIFEAYSIKVGFWPLDGVNTLSSARRHNAKWFRMHRDYSRYHRELDRFLSDPALISKMRYDLLADTAETVESFAATSWGELNDEELVSKFEFFHDQYLKILRPGIILRLLDLAIVPRLRDLIGGDKADDIIMKISVPDEQSYVLKEEITLLNLAIKVATGTDLDEDQELTMIEGQYAWSSLGYFNERPKDHSYYKEKLQEYLLFDPASRLKEISSEQKSLITERDKIVANLSNEAKAVAKLAQQSVDLKDLYKFLINKATYFSTPMFEEISRRVGCPVSYLLDLSPEEIKLLVRGESIDQSIVESRNNLYVIATLDGQFQIFLGPEAEMIEKEYLMPKEMSDEFRGRVASVGYAKGRAKVILNPDQFAKMEVGDILVVANTSPDFTVIMRKAAAIVAEEGGLTAHVSGVSREMKIPAVVGVHYATSMIKDGDLVEVDAEKGVVRIIK